MYEIDYSKLKGRIIEHYNTFGNFCDALGMNQAFLSKVFTGKVFFKQNQILLICTALGIEHKEIPNFFFKLKET